MSKYKIMFWISTGAIFLLESLVPAFTFRSEMSIQGITSLGYPVYFVYLLTAFKVLGGLALIIPIVPKRIKEWAYAGFGFDFISAFVSSAVVVGLAPILFLSTGAMIVLIVSYISYHKLNA